MFEIMLSIFQQKKEKKLQVTFRFLFLFLILLFYNIGMGKATPVVISDVYDSPDPLPWNDGYVNITCVINRVDYSESAVILMIEAPEVMNITPSQSWFIDSQRNGYSFLFNPSQLGTYSYKIYANNTAGEITISSTYTFESATFPYIKSIIDGGSVKWDHGNMTFNVTLDQWTDHDVDTVKVMILSPEVVNITLLKYNSIGQESQWYGIFDPSLKSLKLYDTFDPLYEYKVWANDSSGNVSVSDLRSFVSESYYPVIKGVYQSGLGMIVGENITIGVYVEDEISYTNSSSNINLTQLYIFKPGLTYDVYNMTKINESYYEYNYTVPIEGNYYFRIFVEDEESNKVRSAYYGFSTSPNVYDRVNISVKIAPSCEALVFLLPDGDKILQNQTVIWLSIFENIGNVPLNNTLNISVAKDVILPGEEKWVIKSPNVLAYSTDKTKLVEPLDDSFFFLIWFTYNLPLGNYTAETWGVYNSNVTLDDGSIFECNGSVNDTVHFQLINALGKTQPSPLIVIREMPEQIYQSGFCDPLNLTNSSCIHTTVRNILFNRGNSVAYNITVTDTSLLVSCATNPTDLCYPVRVSCKNTTLYNCSVDYNVTSPDMFKVHYYLKNPLSPREYIILEYDLIPSSYLFVYTNTTYKFDVSGTYSYGDDNKIYKLSENEPSYNPEQSKLLYLRTLPSFTYDLSVESSNSTDQRRSFSADKNESFIISASYISSLTTTGWYINFTFPHVFKILSCSHISGPQCDCSFNTSPSKREVKCIGNSSIGEGDVVKINITANTPIFSDYLFPGYADDSQYNMSEEFIPGLFVLAQSKQIIEVPKPYPQPEPVPEPVPKPQPQPQPENGPEYEKRPLPKVEIVIRPLNDSYVVYQGQTIPTYFNIKNVGNATAYGVNISAIFPSNAWEQSYAYINTLEPGEEVNRTLMIKPGESVIPGWYMLPVTAMLNDSVADITYIKVKVLFGTYLAKMKIIESPLEVEVEEGRELDIPILIRNVGRKVLHNVSVKLENGKDCISFQNSTKIMLKINESSTVMLRIKAKSDAGHKKCKALLIASSDERAYDFSPMIITVYPKPALLPLKKNLTPIISLLWTLIFILYAVIRKRKAMHGEVPHSKTPRIILYMLLLGELTIIIYVSLWIAGVVSIV